MLRAFRWFLACHRAPVSDRPHPVRTFGDRTFLCYTDSIIAKHVMYRSEWFDHDLLHFMHGYLQPGDHFLDVGANTGLHTLLASTRITTGRITCVEPDPKNLARLRRLIDLNHISQATVLPVAASDRAARVSLDGDDVFTHIAPTPSGNSNECTVEAVRLDAALGPEARADFCKIDVEGAEWQVLRGLTGLMERDALPVIAFELNGSQRTYGHDESQFLDWLRSRGYTIAAYRHDEKILSARPPFADNDLFAISASGLALAKTRIPGLNLEAA